MAAADFADVRLHAAADKQPMMSYINGCGMRDGSSRDRPLRDNFTLLEIHNSNMTCPGDDVSHGYVQPVCG